MKKEKIMFNKSNDFFGNIFSFLLLGLVLAVCAGADSNVSVSDNAIENSEVNTDINSSSSVESVASVTSEASPDVSFSTNYDEHSSAEILTLEQAIDIALSKNFGIRIQKNSTKQSENNKILATTSLLPTVDATGTIGYSWKNDFIDDPTNVSGGNTDGYAATAGIDVNWILFDGLRMFKAYDLVYNQADLGKVSEKANIEKTVVQVVAAYYNVASQTKMLLIAKDQLKISQERLIRSKTRAEMGRIVKRELLSAEVSVNDDLSSVEKQKLILSLAKNNLNILLGQEPDVAFDVESEIVLPEVTMAKEEYVAEALKRNSDVEMLKLQIEMADNYVAIKRSAYWPMLIANGGYDLLSNKTTLQRTSFENEIKTGTASVGLVLQWSLWNGLNDKVATTNAKIDQQNAELNLKNYKLQLKSLVMQKWDEVQFNYRQTDFNKKSLQLADENLKISQEMYNIGKLTDVQFRESQLAKSGAAMTYELSMLQAKISLTELEQMIGAIKID